MVKIRRIKYPDKLDGSASSLFWSKITKGGPIAYPGMSECWNWTGLKSSDGYGIFYYKKQMYSAHILSFSITVGERGNLFCCHKCDNRLCVNPEHIFLGTRFDNMRDMISKPREAPGSRNGSKTHPESVRKGERHGRAKLTEQQAMVILSSPDTLKNLSAAYGVSETTIWSIKSRKGWRNITGEPRVNPPHKNARYIHT